MPGFDMRGQALLLGLLTAGLVAAAGCHHDKHAVSVPQIEEYTLPPDEARFNNAPTADYRKPRTKAEEKSLIGNKMGGGGGPLGPGF
jgi:hypothetical protein